MMTTTLTEQGGDEAGVGGVVRGWEDGVASMQLGETAILNLPWLYACELIVWMHAW